MYRDKDNETLYTFQQIADEFDLLRIEYPTIYSYPLFTYIRKFFEEVETTEAAWTFATGLKSKSAL